jgi:hypothetical protein
LKIPRGIQAMVPLLLTPLVALWLDATGNDKAPVFVIRWMAFGVAFWIAFAQLAKVIEGTLALTLAAFVVALAGGFALAALAIAVLSGGRAS